MDYSKIIQHLHQEGNFRSIPADSAKEDCIDFSSNDYLGIGADSSLVEEFLTRENPGSLPMTSVASRLLAGRQSEYTSLERLLDSLYPMRSALLFNSGYHANTGLISAFAGRDSLIIADRLVHASIIDGIMLSRATFKRFAHNDFDDLERILSKDATRYSSVWVVVESVYSMDGDCADISRLIDIKRRFDNVRLYVDEAHAFGVEGKHGLGLVSDADTHAEVDVIVGTFGKAAASIGAFAAMSPLMRDVAVNSARSFIFSTSLPPINVAWTEFVIRKILSMDAERAHLKALGRRLSSGLSALGKPILSAIDGHIQPYIVGDSALAVRLSQQLRKDGLKVLPIRKPTVPAGTERLRISLSAAHTTEQIDKLINALQI